MPKDLYQTMPVQPFDVMRGIEILKEYLAGAAIKYIMRAETKDQQGAIQDLRKAEDCIRILIKEIKHEQEVPF